MLGQAKTTALPKRDDVLLSLQKRSQIIMTCVHRHHHSQQLGVESLVHSKKRSNFLFKCIERGAVELQRLPDLSCPMP